MPGKHHNSKSRHKRPIRYYRPYLWKWPNNSPDGKKVCNNVVFKVIHWNNSKTSPSLPYRNPKTHSTKNISEAEHIMNMIYIIILNFIMNYLSIVPTSQPTIV